MDYFEINTERLVLKPLGKKYLKSTIQYAMDYPNTNIYNDIHIGAVSVYFENDTGELGWMINKNYWGNGFAYEAAKALIYYTKTEIKVNRFLAHCDTENIASYKVMEKLGMSRTGE